MSVLSSSKHVQLQNGKQLTDEDLSGMSSDDLQLVSVDLSKQVSNLGDVIGKLIAEHKEGNSSVDSKEFFRIRQLFDLKRRQRGDVLKAYDMRKRMERQGANTKIDLTRIGKTRSDMDLRRMKRASNVEKNFVDIAKRELPENVFLAILNLAQMAADDTAEEDNLY